ncbi:hypothetical protein GO496_10560 [Acidovorax citrulli]|nr:hypothetical protein [Paracidovorax citrulli]
MTWLTAREPAGLPGLPSTEFRTREKLARLAVPSRPRPGRAGGGGLEYDPASRACRNPRSPWPRASSAPAAARELALVEQAPWCPSRRLPPPPVPLAPLPAPVLWPGPPSAPRQGLRRCTHGADQPGARTGSHPRRQQKACAILALRLASGEGPRELQATARAASQRARGDLVSARTLERYLSIYRAEGWWGLLPAPASVAASTHVDQDVAAVLGLYHSRDARFPQAQRRAPRESPAKLGREIDTWRPCTPVHVALWTSWHVSRGERGAHRGPPQRGASATCGCPSKARHQQPIASGRVRCGRPPIQGQGTPPRPWRALRS